MSKPEHAGAISGIWRFPVKSMQGERIESADITARGLLGDRAFALLDSETGKVVSAKSVRKFPDIFAYRATYVEPPADGQPLPAVRITMPNGSTVDSDAGNVNTVLSESLGHDVKLAQSAPDDFMIDMYSPDIDGADPRGRQNTMTEQKLGATYFAAAGMDSPVAKESFFDLFPMSVITTSTLDQLRQLEPDVDFDERRFRMNLVVDTNAAGFVENDWLEQEVLIGDALKLTVTIPDPRCVMTTLAQAELPRNNDVLRALVKHNRIPIGESGAFPCAGVYAVVSAPGKVAVGDAVVTTRA